MAAERVEFLDAMRGLAIAMVIVNHAGSIAGLTGLVGHFAGLMSYGVQLFFVVSAYTIFLTYSTSVERGTETPARDFFIRRLLRIVPVYWAGIVLYTLVYGLSSRGSLAGPELWHYPLHALLLNIWHPEVQSSVVPGGWSISVEVMFYLTVPLWFALIRNLRNAMLFVALAVIVGPVVVRSIEVLVEPSLIEVSPKMLELWWYRNPLNQLGCFAAGIALYFAVRNGIHLRFASRARNLGVLLLSAAFALAGERLSLPAPQSQHFFSIGFALFGLALAGLPWKLFVNKAIVFLGRISYSGYLLHFLVLRKLILVFPSDGSVGHFLVFASLGVLLTIPLAYLSYMWIERPSMALGKTLIARLNRRTMPAYS